MQVKRTGLLYSPVMKGARTRGHEAQQTPPRGLSAAGLFVPATGTLQFRNRNPADEIGRAGRAARGKLPPHINRKPHLLLTWLNELIRHPRILDAAEQIVGPDILCWGSGFFIKNPHDKARVTWHQDSTYWGLSSPDITTAWIALTPSTTATGCMRVVPGTHMLQQLPHEDTFAPDNLLSRGQEIAVEVNESKAVDIVLKRGQMSLHHVLLVHGSEPNNSELRRVGFAIRYLPTHVKQLTALADSATLVRGSDHYRYFLPEPAPQSDFHPEALAFHAKMLATNDQILYSGTPAKRGGGASAADAPATSK